MPRAKRSTIRYRSAGATLAPSSLTTIRIASPFSATLTVTVPAA